MQCLSDDSAQIISPEHLQRSTSENLKRSPKTCLLILVASYQDRKGRYNGMEYHIDIKTLLPCASGWMSEIQQNFSSKMPC